MSSPNSAVSSSEPETTPPFSSPQEEALLTLMRSADCLHRTLQLRLKPHGLTATQYNVLRILRRSVKTGLTCSAIGSRMITPEPDITRLLTRLKTQKLVSQQRDCHDRRVVWTRITPEGMQILASLDDVMEEAPKELLRELTGDDLRHLIRLLRKASCCSPEPQPQSQISTIAKQPSPHFVRSSLPRHHPE